MWAPTQEDEKQRILDRIRQFGDPTGNAWSQVAQMDEGQAGGPAFNNLGAAFNPWSGFLAATNYGGGYAPEGDASVNFRKSSRARQYAIEGLRNSHGR